jgi:hypothetical protein
MDVDEPSKLLDQTTKDDPIPLSVGHAIKLAHKMIAPHRFYEVRRFMVDLSDLPNSKRDEVKFLVYIAKADPV